MKRSTEILLIIALILGIIIAVLSLTRPSKGLLGGYQSPTLRNASTSLASGSFICGTTTSVAYGPFNGVTYFRATNWGATSTAFLGLAATSSPNGYHSFGTGIVVNTSTPTWDIGMSNINIEGSYLDCVAGATGTVIAYEVAK